MHTIMFFISEIEKRKNMPDILQNLSQGALHVDNCRFICLCLKEQTPYYVQVHTNVMSFTEAVILVSGEQRADTGESILGNADYGIADDTEYRQGTVFNQEDCAAILLTRDDVQRYKILDQLHIYIPKKTYLKGKYQNYENIRKNKPIHC